MSKHVDADALLAALYEADAITPRGAKIIREFPVKVEKEKHGRWEMLSYDEAVCSCCGYDRDTPFYSTREAKEHWSKLPPYCEMCGAILKEEANGKTDDPQC